MMAPTLRVGAWPATLCVVRFAAAQVLLGGRWSVEGCIPTRSVGTIIPKLSNDGSHAPRGSLACDALRRQVVAAAQSLLGGRWSVEGCIPTRTVRRLDVGTIDAPAKQAAGPALQKSTSDVQKTS
jgi:hypothetical protein